MIRKRRCVVNRFICHVAGGGHDRGGYGGLHDRPPQDHYRIGYAGSGGGGGYYRQDNYGGGYGKKKKKKASYTLFVFATIMYFFNQGGGGGGGGGGGYRRDHYQRRDFGPARNYGGGSAGGGNASARIHANPEGGYVAYCSCLCFRFSRQMFCLILVVAIHEFPLHIPIWTLRKMYIKK